MTKSLDIIINVIEITFLWSWNVLYLTIAKLVIISEEPLVVSLPKNLIFVPSKTKYAHSV